MNAQRIDNQTMAELCQSADPLADDHMAFKATGALYHSSGTGQNPVYTEATSVKVGTDEADAIEMMETVSISKMSKTAVKLPASPADGEAWMASNFTTPADYFEKYVDFDGTFKDNNGVADTIASGGVRGKKVFDEFPCFVSVGMFPTVLMRSRTAVVRPYAIGYASHRPTDASILHYAEWIEVRGAWNDTTKINVDISLSSNEDTHKALYSAINLCQPRDGSYIWIMPVDNDSIAKGADTVAFSLANPGTDSDPLTWSPKLRIAGASLGLAAIAAMLNFPRVAYTGFVRRLVPDFKTYREAKVAPSTTLSSIDTQWENIQGMNPGEERARHSIRGPRAVNAPGVVDPKWHGYHPMDGAGKQPGSKMLLRVARGTDIVEEVDSLSYKCAWSAYTSMPLVIPYSSEMGKPLQESLTMHRSMDTSYLIYMTPNAYSMVQMEQGIDYIDTGTTVLIAHTVSQAERLGALAFSETRKYGVPTTRAGNIESNKYAKDALRIDMHTKRAPRQSVRNPRILETANQVNKRLYDKSSLEGPYTLGPGIHGMREDVAGRPWQPRGPHGTTIRRIYPRSSRPTSRTPSKRSRSHSVPNHEDREASPEPRPYEGGLELEESVSPQRKTTRPKKTYERSQSFVDRIKERSSHKKPLPKEALSDGQWAAGACFSLRASGMYRPMDTHDNKWSFCCAGKYDKESTYTPHPYRHRSVSEAGRTDPASETDNGSESTAPEPKQKSKSKSHAKSHHTKTKGISSSKKGHRKSTLMESKHAKPVTVEAIQLVAPATVPVTPEVTKIEVAPLGVKLTDDKKPPMPTHEPAPSTVATVIATDASKVVETSKDASANTALQLAENNAAVNVSKNVAVAKPSFIQHIKKNWKKLLGIGILVGGVTAARHYRTQFVPIVIAKKHAREVSVSSNTAYDVQLQYFYAITAVHRLSKATRDAVEFVIASLTRAGMPTKWTGFDDLTRYATLCGIIERSCALLLIDKASTDSTASKEYTLAVYNSLTDVIAELNEAALRIYTLRDTENSSGTLTIRGTVEYAITNMVLELCKEAAAKLKSVTEVVSLDPPDTDAAIKLGKSLRADIDRARVTDTAAKAVLETVRDTKNFVTAVETDTQRDALSSNTLVTTAIVNAANKPLKNKVKRRGAVQTPAPELNMVVKRSYVDAFGAALDRGLLDSLKTDGTDGANAYYDLVHFLALAKKEKVPPAPFLITTAHTLKKYSRKNGEFEKFIRDHTDPSTDTFRYENMIEKRSGHVESDKIPVTPAFKKSIYASGMFDATELTPYYIHNRRARHILHKVGVNSVTAGASGFFDTIGHGFESLGEGIVTAAEDVGHAVVGGAKAVAHVVKDNIVPIVTTVGKYGYELAKDAAPIIEEAAPEILLAAADGEFYGPVHKHSRNRIRRSTSRKDRKRVHSRNRATHATVPPDETIVKAVNTALEIVEPIGAIVKDEITHTAEPDATVPLDQAIEQLPDEPIAVTPITQTEKSWYQTLTRPFRLGPRARKINKTAGALFAAALLGKYVKDHTRVGYKVQKAVDAIGSDALEFAEAETHDLRKKVYHHTGILPWGRHATEIVEEDTPIYPTRVSRSPSGRVSFGESMEDIDYTPPRANSAGTFGKTYNRRRDTWTSHVDSHRKNIRHRDNVGLYLTHTPLQHPVIVDNEDMPLVITSGDNVTLAGPLMFGASGWFDDLKAAPGKAWNWTKGASKDVYDFAKDNVVPIAGGAAALGAGYLAYKYGLPVSALAPAMAPVADMLRAPEPTPPPPTTTEQGWEQERERHREQERSMKAAQAARDARTKQQYEHLLARTAREMKNTPDRTSTYRDLSRTAREMPTIPPPSMMGMVRDAVGVVGEGVASSGRLAGEVLRDLTLGATKSTSAAINAYIETPEGKQMSKQAISAMIREVAPDLNAISDDEVDHFNVESNSVGATLASDLQASQKEEIRDQFERALARRAQGILKDNQTGKREPDPTKHVEVRSAGTASSDGGFDHAHTGRASTPHPYARY